jgi:Outer membrane protein beta-barrel domain
MYNLLWKQIVLFVMLVFTFNIATYSQKEQWRNDHDDLKYYFGATLGYNTAYLSAQKSDKFLIDDSILVAEPAASGGISLGIQATLKLAKHWQTRFNPQIILGGARYFNYTLGKRTATETVDQAFTLPTTLVSFPLSFKFNSDRIDNFRTYLLFGGKLDVDLSANSAARNQDGYIKLKKYNLGLEAGIGFNLFLRFFTLSPELKFSYGLSDIHDRNPDLKYSSVFSTVKSRMIMFTLHFEN